ncbi:hypothetical protein KIN20_024777 [Parelaphostrongylus tenuis]|uniref:Uncharacterized protein n=1 Tax=Parelaphostrongylus tenuis TaxID=148309 RepID=A0AAD5QWY1_PARTN|nr:hypothetical protein KIN20_024777 [Parelaphostrongylus tenuis]
MNHYTQWHQRTGCEASWYVIKTTIVISDVWHYKPLDTVGCSPLLTKGKDSSPESHSVTGVVSNYNRLPSCCGKLVNLPDNQFHVLSIIVIILTTLILVKLRAIQRKPHPTGVLKSRESNMKQANRNCAGILFISLVFVTFPSVVVGINATSGFAVSFSSIAGPYYHIALLCAGLCSNILHVTLSKDMRALVANFICTKRPAVTRLVNSTKVTSIKYLT